MKSKLFAIFFLVSSFGSASFADECSVTIHGTDTMKFQNADGKPLSTIVAKKKCAELKLTLKHVGRLPAAAMGHNWILVESKDLDEVSKQASSLGPTKGYTPKVGGKVLAATKLLGGASGDLKEDTISIKLDALQAGKDYTFFCSFPGHLGLMKGKFEVQV